MPIITGTGNPMRNKTAIVLFFGMFLFACRTAPKEIAETEITNPKTSVEVTTVKYGSLDDELVLSGTTIYQRRNAVTAAIPAYITKVYIKLGDAVSRGEVLYELESKERRSLGNSGVKLDTSLVNFGIIKVRASASGVISTLDKQQPGDYVLEGTLLCSIAESSDLTFQVNVPYEYSQFTKSGRICQITLPDNSTHMAQFTRSLTSMNVMAQTQTVLAKTNEILYLPENMIVKVTVNKGSSSDKQILPKECVLSDEMMENFWVMKIINDSTAIKIPVTIGNKSNNSTEVITPRFGQTDRIISTGNYGLPDTAFVRIKNSKN